MIYNGRAVNHSIVIPKYIINAFGKGVCYTMYSSGSSFRIKLENELIATTNPFDSLEYSSRLITIPCLVGQGVSKTCQNKCKQEEGMYI